MAIMDIRGFVLTTKTEYSPSGTVLSTTVKLAEKPSLAIALSVLIVKAKIPVLETILPGVF